MTLGEAARSPRTIGAMRTPGSRELVVATVLVVAGGRFVEGPAAAVAVLALAAAIALGTLQVFGEDESPAVSAGIPVESLITPATAAFASFGVLHLVPVGVLLVPALAVVAWLMGRVLSTEARLVHARTGPSEADRTAVLVEIITVGVLGFTAVGTLVPGGLVEPGAAALGSPTGGQLGILAVSDAILAALLGYRAAALRSRNLRDVLWAAAMYGGIIGVAAAALRVIEVPRLLGPALLTLVFFLWDTIHATAPQPRRDPRRLWEAVLLLALGALVVAWTLRLRG